MAHAGISKDDVFGMAETDLVVGRGALEMITAPQGQLRPALTAKPRANKNVALACSYERPVRYAWWAALNTNSNKLSSSKFSGLTRMAVYMV